MKATWVMSEEDKKQKHERAAAKRQERAEEAIRKKHLKQIKSGVVGGYRQAPMAAPPPPTTQWLSPPQSSSGRLSPTVPPQYPSSSKSSYIDLEAGNSVPFATYQKPASVKSLSDSGYSPSGGSFSSPATVVTNSAPNSDESPDDDDEVKEIKPEVKREEEDEESVLSLGSPLSSDSRTSSPRPNVSHFVQASATERALARPGWGGAPIMPFTPEERGLVQTVLQTNIDTTASIPVNPEVIMQMVRAAKTGEAVPYQVNFQN